jgi:hypothetical protein
VRHLISRCICYDETSKSLPSIGKFYTDIFVFLYKQILSFATHEALVCCRRISKKNISNYLDVEVSILKNSECLATTTGTIISLFSLIYCEKMMRLIISSCRCSFCELLSKLIEAYYFLIEANLRLNDWIIEVCSVQSREPHSVSMGAFPSASGGKQILKLRHGEKFEKWRA